MRSHVDTLHLRPWRQETRWSQFQEGRGPEFPLPSLPPTPPRVSLCLSLFFSVSLLFFGLSFSVSVWLCFSHSTPFNNLPRGSLRAAHCPGVFLRLGAFLSDDNDIATLTPHTRLPVRSPVSMHSLAFSKILPLWLLTHSHVCISYVYMCTCVLFFHYMDPAGLSAGHQAW